MHDLNLNGVMRRALVGTYHAYCCCWGGGKDEGYVCMCVCVCVRVCVCVCCAVVFYVSDLRCVSVSFLNVSAVFASIMCWGRSFQSRMVRGKYECL